jgi:hypothetical protein
MLQSDPIPESPPHVASDVNIFEVLTGNRIMKIINAELVPIMIATEGIDFYDKQNAEKAADHIANIIATKELGEFTAETLPRALRGKKLEMAKFTTKILANIGSHHSLHFCSAWLIF